MIFVDPLFALPENAVASTTGYIGALFQSVSPIVWILLALIIGFFIIERLVDIIRG